MQPKDKDALPAKGRKAQGKAVRFKSYSRIDYEYYFFAALGLIARRRWTQKLRRMLEIEKELFLSEKELVQRANGFRNNVAAHPNGEHLAQQQEQTVISTNALSALLSSLISALDRVTSLLRMQPPPPPRLPPAASGICLTPRLLPAPACLLVGR